MADPLALNPEPVGRFNFTQMLPALVFDVAMPIIAFNVLTSYGVTRRHFRRHRGGGLLARKFHNSPSALLKDVFPHYDWKEWLFVHAPSRFWQQRANRHRYFD